MVGFRSAVSAGGAEYVGSAPLVWVTGAGGFLGAAVCRRLAQERCDVQPLVRSSDGGRPAPLSNRLLPPRYGDLDEDAPAILHRGPAPAMIVHCAARIPGSADPDEAEATAAANRRIDDNVFRAAAAAGAGVVFASSGSVYGAGHGQTFVEDGSTAPAIPYAVAKLRSEEAGATLLTGLPFVALRISAPYGPGQSVSTVVRTFLTRALRGDDLLFHGSGSRMQDFVFVDDVADAVARCVVRRPRGVLNVASGRPVSMRELADTVVEATGATIAASASGEPDPQEGRTADYSIAAAVELLDWRPRTSLREGLCRWCEHLRAGRS